MDNVACQYSHNGMGLLARLLSLLLAEVMACGGAGDTRQP